MCKLMSIAGIPPKRQKRAWKFIIESVPFMTQHDDHGLGYVATDGNGMWGERWVDTDQAFEWREVYGPAEYALKQQLGDAISLPAGYNHFGERGSAPTRAIALHSRFATCDVNLQNTHPFLSKDGTAALIHNGVVKSGTVKNYTSTCDSELILNSWVRNGVSKDPARVQDVADDISGYYGVMVMHQTPAGVMLDIWRDAGAKLFVAWVHDIEAAVYCTSDSIIKETAKACKFTIGGIAVVNPGHLIRLNTTTGAADSVTPFEPTKVIFIPHGDARDKYEQWWERYTTKNDKDDYGMPEGAPYGADFDDLEEDELTRIMLQDVDR